MNAIHEEVQIQEKQDLLSIAATTGAQKAGEFFVSRALNSLVDGVKKGYEGAQVLLGTAFERYIKNATLRYNQVRTLATGNTPRSIIGQDNIYVSVGIRYEKKEITTNTIDHMLRISNNILIRGTGGIGKSMLMRYLFLNTANRGEYVPVLLELRKVSNQTIGHVSILDLIYACMSDFDVQLPREQFEYSLRLGKYLFLMDGFDEVKDSHSSETAAAIQAFCAKFPKNPCIITSRPSRDISPLETFTVVESLPLTKDQAIQLASKIWKEDEKTKEFCHQLDTTLYEKHQDFAENPLLLSMMFLTFMRNNSVPNHLAEFYGKAYDALYSAHDSHDKGYYRREFVCKELDEEKFRLLLSHFCFQSYFKEDYEFSEELLLQYLQKSIRKLNLQNVNAKSYLRDLRNVVCLLVKDGVVYRFSHRSFQTYFAACYTASILTDEQQKKLFSTILDGEEVYWEKEDYYELLSQIEPQRFAINALEDGLRKIRKISNKSREPDICLVKLQYSALSISKHRKGSIAFQVGTYDYSDYYYNIIDIFRRFIIKLDRGKRPTEDEAYIISCIDNSTDINTNWRSHELSFETINSNECFTEDERHTLYAAMARINQTAEIREAIASWLDELDIRRIKLDNDDFIDDL